MRNYIIYMPGGISIVTAAFPENHHEISHDWWAVASSMETCMDVCKKLGVENGRMMVVIAADEFYGRYDGTLWKDMTSWRE